MTSPVTVGGLGPALHLSHSESLKGLTCDFCGSVYNYFGISISVE
jgi:hypothetical protein